MVDPPKDKVGSPSRKEGESWKAMAFFSLAWRHAPSTWKKLKTLPSTRPSTCCIALSVVAHSIVAMCVPLKNHLQSCISEMPLRLAHNRQKQFAFQQEVFNEEMQLLYCCARDGDDANRKVTRQQNLLNGTNQYILHLRPRYWTPWHTGRWRKNQAC